MLKSQFILSLNNPIVSTHKVYGQEILPGVAYIDLIYQVFQKNHYSFDELELRHVTIYAPLTVSSNQGVNLIIECLEEGANLWMIKVLGEKRGDLNIKNETTLYCSAEMHKKDRVVFDEKIDVKELTKPAKPSGSLESFYKICREEQLEHTGFIKAIGDVYKYDDFNLVDISLGEIAAQSADHFIFHPTIVDGSGIGSGLFPLETEEGRLLYLPLFIESFRASERLKSTCYAVIHKSNIVTKNDLLYLSIHFYNRNGFKIAALDGFANKLVRDEGLINPSRKGNRKTLKFEKKEQSEKIENEQKERESRSSDLEGIEKYLAELIRGYLEEEEEIDIDAGYYEMGVDSPSLIKIVKEIGVKIDTTLMPTLLFEYTTIRSLALYLHESYGSQFGGKVDISISDTVERKKTKVFKEKPNSSSSDIAIIGMSGKYPQAKNISEFWENLCEGLDCISEVPSERWDWRDVAKFTSPSGKPLSKWGGFIDDVSSFDPQFFKISPRDAETMDPQERLFLEVCWESMEDAGYRPDNLISSDGQYHRNEVGVFVGVMHKDYTILGAEAVNQGDLFPISLTYAPIANRVSYFCDFHGPSMAIDTVCSSSLTAVHLAINSIRNGECKVALAGGVNLSLHPDKYLSYGLMDLHSSDGYCKTFGADGDGYVPGEGIGAVLLKPLEKAIKDGDNIYAVIKESTINHGGKVGGFYVPSPVAQSDMISTCFSKAKIDPRSISYVEAHGTGTSLGDPIEIQGLVKAFRGYTDDVQYCAIGSVKSNIGHAESAAGISGLTKAVLQLFHKTLVPSLHSETPNPYIDFAESPFYVQQKKTYWERPFNEISGKRTNYPRRSTVSSFGASGSNAHLILEEYEVPPNSSVTIEKRNYIVPISARTTEQLVNYVNKILLYFKTQPSHNLECYNPEILVEKSTIRQVLSEIIEVDENEIQYEQSWRDLGVELSHLNIFKRRLLDTEGVDVPDDHLFSSSSIHSLYELLQESKTDQFELLASHDTRHLANVAYTLQVGRVVKENRVAFICENVSELLLLLEKYLENAKDDRIFVGNVKKSKKTIAQFKKDQNYKKQLESWIANNDVGRLADIWAKGMTVDWTKLYVKLKPKRVSLPTYPFLRDKYWLPITIQKSNKGSMHKILHPLVHENVSDLSIQKYRTVLSGEEIILTQHKVGGEMILPGSAYLEMAYAAFRDSANHLLDGRNIKIKNVHWLKPVIVKDQPVTIEVRLSNRVKDDLAFEIHTQLDDKSFQLNCSGQYQLLDNQSLENLNIQECKRYCSFESVPPEKIYSLYKSIGVSYGESFRGIRAAYISSDDMALVEIDAPVQIDVSKTDYFLPPAVLDSVFQTVLVFDINNPDVSPALAFALDELIIHGDLPSKLWVWLKKNNRSNENVRKYDIIVANQSGEICLELFGVASKKILSNENTDERSSFDAENYAPDQGLVFACPQWSILTGLDSKSEATLDEDTLLVGISAEEIGSVGFISAKLLQFSIDENDTINEISNKLSNYSFKNIIWNIENSIVQSDSDLFHLAQEKVLVTLLRFIQSIVSLGYENQELNWIVVTRGALVIGPNDKSQGVHSSVHGFMGAIIKEFSKWRIRLVDIALDTQCPWSDIIRVSETTAGESLAYRNKDWYLQHLTLVDSSKVGYDQSGYKKGGVYVIIGGAGGVGRAWSSYMIEHYSATIIWVGRRELDDEIQRKILEAGLNNIVPIYFSADASDSYELKKIRDKVIHQYGRINGVVQSAMILDSADARKIKEDKLKLALDAKLKVNLTIGNVFGKDELDFCLFFSSINSFVRARGQASYSAGCLAADMSALYYARQNSWNVKIMNWGYWGDAGIVSDSVGLRSYLEQKGIGTISTLESMNALEILIASPVRQLSFFRAHSSEGFEGMRMNNKQRVYWNSENISSLSFAATSNDIKDEFQDSILKKSIILSKSKVENVLSKLLLSTLFEISGEDTISGLSHEAPQRIIDKYKRWWSSSLEILDSNGFVVLKDGKYILNEVENVELESCFDKWEQLLLESDAYMSAWKNLLDVTFKKLPNIISGEVRATDVMFPRASLELVEGIYKNNPSADYFNSRLVLALVDQVRKMIEHEPGVQIRILEIGAGTGGTTRDVLKGISSYSSNIEEYCYTDISKAFLIHGEEEFKTEFKFVRGQLLNVESPIEKQEIEIGSYHIVIAANILHATKNIRNTVQNVKACLKPHGMLFINEMSQNSILAHMTFGLLDGWWMYNDPSVRIPGCPGVSAENWKYIFIEKGFYNVIHLASAGHDLDQQVIFAQSNGVITQEEELNVSLSSNQPPNESPVIVRSNRAIEADPAHKESIQLSEETEAYNIAIKEVSDVVKDKLSEVLKINIEKIDVDEPFADYGLDSIVGVGLVSILKDSLGVDLETTVLFDYSTVNDLSSFIIKNHFQSLNLELKSSKDQEHTTNVSIVDSEKRVDGPLGLFDKLRFSNLESSVYSKAVPEVTIEKPAAITPEEIIQSHSLNESIAVIGISGRYPGADDLGQLWEHLANGVDLVERSNCRWDIPHQEDVYFGSFLESIDRFDPFFFNISGLEASYMDPQQRIFLEECWKALEHAGYAGSSVNGLECGVYVGNNGGDYHSLFEDVSPPQAMWGNLNSVMSARISYYLNLKGPAISIDTACSSSLVAIHLACQSLWTKETDMALAGGVFVRATSNSYLEAKRGGMLSSSGKCHTFDKDADGFVVGEGAGVVVLKRYSDALADRDHIYAVIKGSAINQDGKSNGITAPSAISQEKLECKVYDRFNIDPKGIQFVEAHGTGTKLGDPIEFSALTKAFRKYTDATNFCALGSIKTNLGHTAAVAGVTGFLKIVLALQDKKIPASLNFNESNPDINLKDSPFYINSDLIDWPKEVGRKRMAAVSSFGLSGTNAHVVIEEGPVFVDSPRRISTFLFVLSAKTSSQLKSQVERLLQFFMSHDNVDLGNSSYTLLTGRKHFNFRWACIASSREELMNHLISWLDNKKNTFVFHSSEYTEKFTEKIALKKLGNQSILNYQLAESDELSKEDLSVVAELFVLGYKLNYTDLYDKKNFRKIGLPTYPFAHDSYWVPNSSLKVGIKPSSSNTALHNGIVESKVDKFKNITLCPKWEKCEFSKNEEASYQESRVYIIGDDKRLIQSICDAYPTSEFSKFVRPDSFSAIAEEISNFKSGYHIYWLAEDLVGDDKSDSISWSDEMLRLFRFIKNLIFYHLDTQEVRLTIITREGQAIEKHDNINLPHSGIHGFVGSLAKELAHWKIRLLDLPKNKVYRSEFNNVPFDKYGHGVLFRSSNWYRQILYPLDLSHFDGVPYKTDKVYVVIGGSGGIGSVWSESVIQQANSQIVWIGRSQLNASIQTKLDQLSKKGRIPIYIQGDATDKEQLQVIFERIVRDFGAVHGVVHSALLLSDSSIRNMTDDVFLNVVRSKIQIGSNIAAVFESEHLDFILFFSAINSFGKSAGQSNYVAGSVLLDALAHNLDRELDCMVKTINWGYWGEVGVVSGDDFKESMRLSGVGSIRPQDGMDLVARVLASNYNQVGFIRSEWPIRIPGVLFEGRAQLVSEEKVNLLPEKLKLNIFESLKNINEPLVESLQLEVRYLDWISNYFGIQKEPFNWNVELREYGLEQNTFLDFVDSMNLEFGTSFSTISFLGYDTFRDVFSKLEKELSDVELPLLKALFLILKSNDLLPGSIQEKNPDQQDMLIDLYEPWLQETLDLFDANNLTYLENENDNYQLIWDQWEVARDLNLSSKTEGPWLSLVDKILTDIPRVLKGQVRATEILFPNSDASLVERIYSNNPVADYFNEIVGLCVQSYIQERLSEDPSATISIIEIGAGTGGTTRKVLPKITSFKSNIKRYCFTDISQSFLSRAKTDFENEYPFVDYEIIDIGKPIREKSSMNARFDIVIAANVMHATYNVNDSLQNTARLLKGNGLLVLNEMADKTLFAHLTFGLLEGWWLSQDEDIRIPGCPGIYPDQWKDLLKKVGFDEIYFPAERSHHLKQQIVVGHLQKDLISIGESERVKNVTLDVGQNEISDFVLLDTKDSDVKASDMIKTFLAQLISDDLKIKRSVIRNDYSFSEFGVDSLSVVSLTNKINKQFSIELPSTIMFDYNSINKLSDHLLLEHKASVSAVFVNPSDRIDSLVSPITRAQPDLPIANHDNKVDQSDPDLEAIAIIGISGRFPKSKNLEELWVQLSKDADLTDEITRWDISEVYDPTIDDKSRCLRGGFLDNIKSFDPDFFKITGLEAKYMDPQQRLFLEESWSALEQAGYANDNSSNLKCGVYVGSHSGDYIDLIGEDAPAQSFWGNAVSLIPSRIAYYLNLQGPAMAIDTACSSSLVAIHTACQAIRSGEISMAISGGVFVQCTPRFYSSAGKAGMLSNSGSCFTFDKRADGFAPGEGVGVVVLKKVSDAERDGDFIHAVIRGSGVNQDGNTNGIIAPSALSQERLERQVYDKFGIEPRNIGLLEAHGTATSLGDPIEFRALKKAFADSSNDTGYCALGSIKANIGHASAAAGVAGLLKVVLALQNKKIPPYTKFQQANESIDLQNSPFYINPLLKSWERPLDSKRLAAVSAFGFSGTNAHLVIEEAPEPVIEKVKKPAYLFCFSAQSIIQVQQQVKQIINYNRSNSVDIGDVSYTLLTKRRHFSHRLACVAETMLDLTDKLEKWISNVHVADVWYSSFDKYDVALSQELSESGEILLRKIEDCKNSSDYHETLNGLGDLFVSGSSLDFNALFNTGEYRTAPLPTYSFRTEEYWIEELKKREDVEHKVINESDRYHDMQASENVGVLASEDIILPRIEARLKSMVSSVAELKLEKIRSNIPFEDFGLDSILINQLNKEIEKITGKKDATLFYKFRNIRELSDYLFQKHSQSFLATGDEDLSGQIPMPKLEKNEVIEEDASGIRGIQDIAVIGMSGKFPEAENLDEFWKNLVDGKDCITEIPEDRWALDKFFESNKIKALEKGLSYSKWGGFLKDYDCFDPLFFGISPRSAELMDPQERLFLQTAWATIEDAGYTRANFESNSYTEPIGVFVGATFNNYQLLMAEEALRNNRPMYIANSQIYSIANRVSYVMNFKGPSLTVDTACSSSLYAVHLACESIYSGQCKMALAGGVNLSIHPSKYITLSQEQFSAEDGRCRAFSEGGTGYVPSEAVGAVFLKPLEQAIKDGDHIYGVIKGTAATHAGKTNGYTIPNPASQSVAIENALKAARINPRTINHIEAHGTGTSLGDPIEYTGLTDVFEKYTEEKNFCSISSVKSNIGHAEAAAGVAQLAKVLLQFKYGTLVKNLMHGKSLNSNIDFEDSPFYIQESTHSWRKNIVDGKEFPRRSGVSSFGAGGANAHIVLEEYVYANQKIKLRDKAPKKQKGAQIIILSAQSKNALRQKCVELLSYLRNPMHTQIELEDVAYTLALGREEMRERVAFIAKSRKVLIKRLNNYISEEDHKNIFKGSITQYEESDALEKEDSIHNASNSKLLKNGKFKKLLKKWVNGSKFNWANIYVSSGNPKRVPLPTYPFAKERYWVHAEKRAFVHEGYDLANEHSSDIVSASENLVYHEEWEEKAINVINDINDQIIVCFLKKNDSRLVARKQLREINKTSKIVFVSSSEDDSSSEDLFKVDVQDLNSLESVFRNIVKEYGHIDSIFYMWTLEDRVLCRDYRSTTNIIKALHVLGSKEVSLLLCGEYFEPLDGAYLNSWIGYSHSLKLVAPQVKISIIQQKNQLDREVDIKSWSKRLWKESQNLDNVLYEDELRKVSRIKEGKLENSTTVFRVGATYLITGGCGGLGKIVSDYLVTKYKANLVIVGRSRIDEEREKMIRDLRSQGSKITYVAADVSAVEDLEIALRDAHVQIDDINGIIHAAGVPGSESIFEKPYRDFKRVLKPKVGGVLSLHSLFAKVQLDFVCYFSSSSASLGDFGSCDYSIGNRFMVGFAKSISSMLHPTIVLSWPLWKEGGMQFDDDEITKMYLKSSGQELLDNETGIDMLEKLLAQPSDHHLLFVGQKERIDRFLGLSENLNVDLDSILKEDFIKSVDVSHDQSASINDRLETDVSNIVSALLKIPKDRIIPQMNLVDFGFDSIRLMNFSNLLNRKYALNLTPAIFYSYPTLAKLQNHLIEKYQEVFEEYYLAINTVEPLLKNDDPRIKEDDENIKVGSLVHEERNGTKEDIAIVGMSGRFPNARSIDEMWQILKGEMNAVKEASLDRFDWREFYGDPMLDPTKSNSKWIGEVPGVREFDPKFFEISPREAMSIDPRQRLLLQESWKALEDAGYGPKDIKQNVIGVFVGVEDGDYHLLDPNSKNITSNHNAILASRLAYFLNLDGPVMAINTACSSGLVAAHQACQSIRNGECSTAVVAGVNLVLSSDRFVWMGQAGMLSKDGRCATFDKKANGLVPGEAVVSVILKSLSDAQKDGDPIYAVIRGSGLNYDGRTNGITAPNGLAQTKLLNSVYEDYKINPENISYVVTHGTGTRLGDPVEVNALNDSFKSYSENTEYCALTSTKTNFGHTLAASGLVNMICLVNALRYKVIPASLHCSEENDFINWEDSPFYVNKNSKKWKVEVDTKRLGAISAFGMSGTNAHMVIEEYEERSESGSWTSVPTVIVLSAKGEVQLINKIRELCTFISQGIVEDFSLGDISYTLLRSRHHFSYRCAIVASDTSELSVILKTILDSEDSQLFFKGELPDNFSPLKGGENKVRKLLDQIVMSDLNSEEHLECIKSVAKLFCEGFSIDGYINILGESVKKIHLPTYPFLKNEYWIDTIKNQENGVALSNGKKSKKVRGDFPEDVSRYEQIIDDLMSDEITISSAIQKIEGSKGALVSSENGIKSDQNDEV